MASSELQVPSVSHVTRSFLVAALVLVHAFGTLAPDRACAADKNQDEPKAKSEAATRQVWQPGTPLPTLVDQMREAMLDAIADGHIEALRYAFELNELKPDLGAGFGAGGETDPVAYWKKNSGDGEGREILAALRNILEMPAAVVPLGQDVENNKVYVWPYLADLDLGRLSPAQEIDLYRLMPASEAKAMRAGGQYAFWRVHISAAGVWLSFTRN